MYIYIHIYIYSEASTWRASRFVRRSVARKRVSPLGFNKFKGSESKRKRGAPRILGFWFGGFWVLG